MGRHNRATVVFSNGEPVGTMPTRGKQRRWDHVITKSQYDKQIHPPTIDVSAEVLEGCERPCRRSLSFAYHEELDGQQTTLRALIGGTKVEYRGIVRKAAGKKSARRWALHDAVKV
jgi:hypothetical protein